MENPFIRHFEKVGRESMFEEYGLKKIGVEDIVIYEKYYGQMEGPWASSICIDSMLAWNHSIITYYKIINEYLVSIAYDIVNKRYVCLPFIGNYKNGHLKETMTEINCLFDNMGMDFLMTDIYQWMLDKYLEVDGFTYNISKDEGLSDYIYKMDDFKNALDKQDIRYNIRYFMRKYHPVIEEIKEGDLHDCIDFIDRVWCSVNDCSECQYGCQKITAENIIKDISKYNAKGVLIRSEGNMIAYCIISVRKNIAIFHFKKTARGYRGVNEVLHRECVDRFCDGAALVNYTEDMNHEGLRKYKQRLCSYYLEPKYEIHIKIKNIED